MDFVEFPFRHLLCLVDSSDADRVLVRCVFCLEDFLLPRRRLSGFLRSSECVAAAAVPRFLDTSLSHVISDVHPVVAAGKSSYGVTCARCDTVFVVLGEDNVSQVLWRYACPKAVAGAARKPSGSGRRWIKWR